MKFRHARLIGALLLLLSLCSRAGTVVTLGSITQINGPADPGLDLVGEMLHAINFSANDGPLVVSGVTFTPDTALAAGVITVGPNQVAPWQTKPDFGIGADNDNLEEVMQDIRWANNNAGQVLSASLPVVSGESYKVQILFYGNHAGDDRRWDIEVEGTLAVDEVSSRGVTTAPFPGGLPAYSGSAAIVYTQTLVAGDSMLNIRMGSLGGANDAGDRNAIWQALTVERLLLVDTDSDGLADEWELAKTQPPNLTDLNGLEAGPGPGANTGDFDGDGSLDINELANNTNPTNKDTDGDGLNDNVETGTGIFVNAGDAGTNPRNIDSDGDGLSDGQEVTGSLHYPKAVIGLNPKFYYRLDETSTSAGVIDAMGSAAPGSYNGDYINGPAMVGGPGPVEAFGGIALPGVGGAANLAHYSNNAGHIVLGPGSNYGANNITVALFLKAGSAQGGDRIFTNNLADNTKSFQIVTANDGLVLAIDPSASGANAERTLFLEDNSGPDRRLIDPNAGWFHVVASTSGATGPERASNFRLWINGIDRTDNLKPNVTGWGINTNFAKIGGRRDNPTDSTTHSGAQDEVSIWLDRVLTETEVQSLWTAARAVTPATDPTKVDTDGDGIPDGAEVDSDNDGFNDMTEVLNGSNPTDGGSVPPPGHVVRVFGGDAGEGLDLSGSFLYAFNVGTESVPVGVIGDADFTLDNSPGIAVTAPNEILNWTNPQLGASAADDALETVFQSIRWADLGNGDPNMRAVRVDLASLVPGRNYKLQLLFAEQCCPLRSFDVTVDGVLVADNFNISMVQGTTPAGPAGAAVIYSFTATDDTLNIVLDGADVPLVPGVDRNATLSGVTLEELVVKIALDITAFTQVPAGFRIDTRGTPGKSYSIDWSADLLTWDEVQDSLVPDASGNGTWTDTDVLRVGPGVRRGFYKLRDPSP